MRRLLFWFHLFTGVIAGSIILIMVVTGSLLVFMPELTTWVETRGLPPIHASGAPLPPEEIVHQAEANSQAAGRIGLLLRSRNRPAEVRLGNQTLYLDPFSGVVLGRSSPRMRAFSDRVRSLHTSLGAMPSLRRQGKAVIDICNFAFLCMTLTGIYIWFPRKWNWTSLRSIILFRPGLSGRAQKWNWHNVAGIWCVIPLFLITSTGVIMSYDWAADLVFKASGNPPPTRFAGPPPGLRGGGGRVPGVFQPSPFDLSGLNHLVDVAEAESPGWDNVTTNAFGRAGQLSCTVETDGWFGSAKRMQFTLDHQSGSISARPDGYILADAGVPKFDLVGYLHQLHQAEVGGLPGKLIAFFACVGGLLLIYTGFAMAYRRYLNWRRRQKTIEVRETVGAELKYSSTD